MDHTALRQDPLDQFADDAREQRRRDRRHRRHANKSTIAASPWGRALIAAVVGLAAFTLAGLILLWPADTPKMKQSAAMGGPTLGAKVVRERLVRCPGPAGQRCRQIDVQLTSGAKAGSRSTIDLGPAATIPALGVGAKVRVQPVQGYKPGPGMQPYSFTGIDRRGVLLWIALAFAVLVVVLTRLRGLLALVGFAASVALVTRFLVPAILAGSPALLVAVVGSLAVMFITVVLTYGLSPPTLAACLGIAASLLFAAVMGVAAVRAAHLDGRSGELAMYFATSRNAVSLQGVVLAGMVIASLGVLADMGVTQASAVMALRHANPSLSARRLYRGAFSVGRDHLVATTHTLVLVYVGATLPLLLLMRASGVAITDALNSQEIAEPIVATLVGAMALFVSVPITTALSAAVVHRIPAEAFDGHHGHPH